YQQYDKSPPTF
nr:immunoglobulin light chain junction region [Macaca mulatta]